MATDPDEGRTLAPSGDVAPPFDEKPPDDELPRPGSGLTPTPRPTPRPADPVRRALLGVPIVAVVVGLVVVLAGQPTGTPVPSRVGSGSPSAAPPATAGELAGDGYLVTLDELRRRGRLAADGKEPYASAVADLLAWANGALDEVAKPTQPLVVVGTDNPFVDDARRAYGLGLAYGLTGDERFAEAAKRTIRAWVDVATTTSDTCPDSGGCHTSLIIGRAGAGFAFGADLIAGSRAWSADDRAALATWLHDVLLPAASHRPTNWGDAGTFLRVVAADYSGDRKEFDAAITKWRSMIDLIEADGRIPEEVRRGSAGISYTQEALQYKVAVAYIAERRGVHLWDYVGRKGGSLRAAIDRLADYWHRPEDWPDYPRARVPSTGPLWEIVYARWKDARWVDILLDRRPYGDQGHSAIRWTTLTNGIPIEPLGADAPSASPAASGSAGPAGPSSSPTSPPGLAAPVTGLALRLGPSLGKAQPVTVRWDAPAAGTTIELERSVAGGGWSPMAVPAGRNAVTDSIERGDVHAYRVRATVGADAGPWTVLGDVLAERIEASSSTVDVAGGWTRVSSDGYSSDTAFSTDARGARLTWTGTTQALAIVGPTGPTRGRMVITVDGDPDATVDLYSSRFRARVVLFEVSWRIAGPHEIRIEAQPAGGRRTVAVDDIVTLRSTVSAQPGS